MSQHEDRQRHGDDSSVPLADLARLVAALADEAISDADAQRLNDLLRRDAAARRYYMDFMAVHSSLQSHVSGNINLAQMLGGAGAESESDAESSIFWQAVEQERAARIKREAEEALQRQQAEEEEKRRRASWARMMGLGEQKQTEVHKRLIIPTPVFYSGIAALLAVALWVGWVAVSSILREKPGDIVDRMQQPTEAERPVVATLIRTLDAVWAERHVEVRKGEGHEAAPLEGGAELREGDSYTLTWGFAQLETNRGAIVVLEAPCEIALLGENRVKLSRGKLVGECSTVASKGFTVDTPTARVVDLGTEFGVATSEAAGTEVEVFGGSVNLSATGESAPTNVRPTTIRNGQIASTDGRTVSVVASPGRSRFARSRSLERTESWLTHRDMLMRDPSLIAYYAFDQPPAQTLSESRGRHVFDAEVSNAHWTQGRLPGKQALDFGGPDGSGSVRFSASASNQLHLDGPFTIAIWFKVRSLPPLGVGWASLISRGNDSWRLMFHRDGRLGFFVPVTDAKAPNDGGIPPWEGVITRQFELDRWHLLVLTGKPQGTQSLVQMYIDGKSVSSKLLSEPPSVDAMLAIGSVKGEIGDYGFDGRVDEIAFFSRTLSSEQVKSMFEAGQPADLRE